MIAVADAKPQAATLDQAERGLTLPRPGGNLIIGRGPGTRITCSIYFVRRLKGKTQVRSGTFVLGDVMNARIEHDLETDELSLWVNGAAFGLFSKREADQVKAFIWQMQS